MPSARNPGEPAVAAEIAVVLSGPAVEALRPWIAVEEVGGEGFSSWLESIVRLLPVPRSPSDRSSPVTVEPVSDLARALIDCASDRARTHFEAATYFADNQVLARRVKALEAMLRTRARAQGSGAVTPQDPESDRVGDRYLPRNGSP